jgi:hypothetical protein
VNLEAIAMMRAQEQVSRRGSAVIQNPACRPAKKPKAKRTGKVLRCVCGTCSLCRKRDWQRRWRAKRARSPQCCAAEGCLKHVHSGAHCERHAWQLETFGVVFPNRRRVASSEMVERARARLADRGIVV